MRCLWLMALLPLAGCTWSYGVLNEELPKYNGKPVSALIAKLGYPDAEQTVMGHKVYLWSNGGIGTASEPIGDSCRLRAMVNAAEVVTWLDYMGNDYGCRPYSRRLER